MKWWRPYVVPRRRHCEERSDEASPDAARRPGLLRFARNDESDPMTSDRLFVYGTLMRGYVHPMAKLLSANADFLGEASCCGRLYMVKHYPGLVLSDDTSEIVHGELYRLHDVDAMLREFDMYE